MARLRRLLRRPLRMGRPLQGQWRCAGAGHGDALREAVARGARCAAPGGGHGGHGGHGGRPWKSLEGTDGEPLVVTGTEGTDG